MGEAQRNPIMVASASCPNMLHRLIGNPFDVHNFDIFN